MIGRVSSTGATKGTLKRGARMKKTLDDILNPPSEPTKTVEVQVEVKELEQKTEQTAETTTGAAAASSPEEEVVQATADTDKSDVQKERAALGKERERVRRKEAELLERESRLNAGTTAEAEGAAVKPAEAAGKADPKAELKELRSLYRNAMLEGDSEETERLEDLIDEKLIETSMQRQSSMSVQQQEEADWKDAYKGVHDDFPFIKADHPQANADLNNNINTYLSGAIAQGKPRAVALKEAVNLFAPAYAARLELESESVDQGEATDTSAADKVKERLKKQGFAEIRSANTKGGGKGFSGITPMTAILGKP